MAKKKITSEKIKDTTIREIVNLILKWNKEKNYTDSLVEPAIETLINWIIEKQ